MSTDSKQKINKRSISKWCRERNCKFSFYGDKPSILLLGESHNTPRHLELEEEMISLVKPPILLHEFLKNNVYDPTTGNFSFVYGTANDEMDIREMHEVEDYLLGWANKYRAKLVGADLSLFELSKAGDEIEKKKPRLILTSQTPEECEYREKRMGERIANYRKKVDGMLVGIFGMHHLRPSSDIHPILQLEGIEYACIIMPKDKKK
jgi:hypothetical protein